MTVLSLASILAESARRTPDRVAVVEGEARVTYAALWRDALVRAAALQQRGLGAGARVAILAPNVTDFVRTYYGVVAAGGVVVPIPTLLGPEEATYLVQASGAELLLHHASYAEVAAAVSEQTGVAALDLVDLPGDAEPLPAHTTREADDPAVIFYTSGTTGRPKGAVLTHLNLVLNATTNAFDANPIRRDDVVLGCLPLFHTFGQSVSMNSTFRVGATLVLQPRFEPAGALALMREHATTLFFGVPTMYIQLLAAARSAEQLPRLRECVSGGASLPVAVLEEFEKTFATTVFEGYGLSETSPTASVNQPWYGTRAGTVGHPIWGVDVEIADEHVLDEIRLLPRGELGEIVIRGHNVFAGYLDDPDATAAAIVDGWFRSGDIGRRDEDGFISIVDRTKDLIIRGGFNVYPREVEEVLMRHEGIAQVAVIGLPDDQQGEEVCAVVVPAPDTVIEAADLVAWSRERLAGHKYPRVVHVVDELPVGPTHKVLKRELRTRFTA
ncbi:long-chain-fatty-acid--CoA ligase [Nocardioides aurantiacus]|uniref:Long-chain acyl-CoA synthetase n=1 Tax=Nocardioides aurantiacus TaxID=86796 RepID=A0A3N2CQ62_9ACTN|nr:long-chain fatty acid--CoA ligase [Nocardioides aurantiacus]ROR89660.1 long-chain acyl-CoA synthetase [Nocardioides aurantiacus]